MNKEDIQEIREYIMDKLEFQGDGSYPKERKILEKILVLTTETLNTHRGNYEKSILPKDSFHPSLCGDSQSSSKASQEEFNKEFNKALDKCAETYVSPKDTQSKSKTNSEDLK